MDKVEALKNIAGSSASGDTIVEVLESMSGVVDTVNGNAEGIGALQAKFPTPKEIVLESSTADSTKKFKITVVDGGTIAATEIV